ncbi:aerotaxis receptor Aer [Xenophilus sp. AP218F]|nr:PAS domain-containing protein [Chromobacterium sp. ASV5]OWY38003.1 aerotaxis receptor Aer [Xenophilus sp. AP218F]
MQATRATGQHGREILLEPDELIITKTDPTGHITYANRVFMRIAGYAEHELLGKPHNLIRHPDMPRGAYRLMWQTLQAGQEFFAIVKNAAASGDYYWVLANVTPDYDVGGKLQGYYSVRRPPSRKAIAAIEPVYAEMRRIEAASGKAAAPDASRDWLLQQVAAMGLSYQAFILQLNADVLKAQGVTG